MFRREDENGIWPAPTNVYQQYETQRQVLIDYLQVMVARSDWHGVADAAMDLREMEAERKRHEP